MLPLMAAGAILGAAGEVGKFISGIHQRKEAKSIHPVWQQYQSSPFAAQQLGLAQQLYNGRMAGAASQEKNIFQNQANFGGAVRRNATDSSQALALAAQGQGNTNDALSDLQMKESQNKYSMLGNLNNAYGQMIGEGDKVYQSQMQKYMADVQRKDQLNNAGAQNQYGAASDLSSMAFQGAQLGWFNKQPWTPQPVYGKNPTGTNPDGSPHW